MPPTTSSRLARLLLAAAVALGIGGAVVAIVQPGDLGEDEVESEQAATTTTTATTTAGGESTTTGATVTVTTAEQATSSTATTESTTTTTTGTTTTTAPGSGLGSDGTSRADENTAATGMESMLAPGLALAGAALVLRRTIRRA